MRKQGARGAGAADVGHTWGQGGRKMSKARPRDRYCRSRWGFRLTPDATCLPRHKGTPARGQVARQRAGVGHRHGACQDTCLGRGRGARMCVHAAREVPLARSQHGLGQLLTPFLPQEVKPSSGTDFSSNLPKEFDDGKTLSLLPPFHPLPQATTWAELRYLCRQNSQRIARLGLPMTGATD